MLKRLLFACFCVVISVQFLLIIDDPQLHSQFGNDKQYPSIQKLGITPSVFEFSEDEDAKIVQHVKRYGTQKWEYVSLLINKHRKHNQEPTVQASSPWLCKQRWFKHLNSSYFYFIFPQLIEVNQTNWSIHNYFESIEDDKVIYISDNQESQRPNNQSLIPPPLYPRGRLIDNDSSPSNSVRDGDRIVFYLHVHKAGGTQVCRLAKHHQWLDQALPNCNFPGFGPINFKQNLLKLVKGDGLYLNIKSTGWKFVMSEVPLLHSLQLNHFLYAIQIRQPISRIKSHMRFHRQKENQIINVWTSKNNVFHPFIQTKLGEAVTTGTAPYDNFLIRILSGFKTFSKNPQTINEIDYLRARDILSKFECIIIMERYALDAKLQFSRLFGWQYWLHTGRLGMPVAPAQVKTTAKQSMTDNEERIQLHHLLEQRDKSSLYTRDTLSLEGEAMLMEINQLDLKLYEDAKLFSDHINLLAWQLPPPERHQSP